MYDVNCYINQPTNGTPMSKTDDILAAVRADKTITATALIERFAVSRQHIYALCKRHGLKLRRSLQRPRARPERKPTGHFGQAAGALSTHFIGGASELTACADLLRRGVPVYRAITFVSAADLIIDFRGKLIRVEVRSAKRNNNGPLRYQAPINRSRYEVLALVDGHGAVTYKPNIFDG
jgi:hypothetical protein